MAGHERSRTTIATLWAPLHGKRAHLAIPFMASHREWVLGEQPHKTGAWALP